MEIFFKKYVIIFPFSKQNNFFQLFYFLFLYFFLGLKINRDSTTKQQYAWKKNNE